MKRFLCLITLIALLVTSLTSCDKRSIDDYKAKFQDHTFTHYKNPDEINDMARDLHLNAEEYKVREVLYAHSGNSGVPIGVVIIECGSKSKAEDLGARDAYVILDYLKTLYSTNMYPMTVSVDGKFVLIGTQKTISSIT